MTAETKLNLVKAGIDVDESVERLMNNEDLFLRILKKFPDDPSYEALQKAVEADDAAQIFEASHALKGVSSNLGLARLLEALYPIVETSRAGKTEGICDNMPKLSACYEEVEAAIQNLD